MTGTDIWHRTFAPLISIVTASAKRRAAGEEQWFREQPDGPEARIRPGQDDGNRQEAPMGRVKMKERSTYPSSAAIVDDCSHEGVIPDIPIGQ